MSLPGPRHSYLAKWSVLGAVAGAAAWLVVMVFKLLLEALTLLIDHVHSSIPLSNVFPVDALLIAVAAAASGLIVQALSRDAAGPGIDHVVDSYHTRSGYISAATPGARIAASTLLIAGGASAGAAGAVAQASAGVASLLHRFLNTSELDRAVLAMAGLAGGVSAILHAPITAALFAAEVLYRRDFEHIVLYPSLVSATTAYLLDVLVSGHTALLHLPTAAPGPIEILLAAAAGFLAGGAARLFTYLYQLIERGFSRIEPLPLRTFLGGAVAGVMIHYAPSLSGTGLPEALSVMANPLLVMGSAALLLAAGKLVATAATVGSGGSGGLFAPSIYTGAFIGAFTAWLYSLFFDIPAASAAMVVAAGVAGYTGSVLKIPLASVLLLVEITWNPLLLVVGLPSIAAAFIASGPVSIYRSQRMTRLDSPLHRPLLAAELFGDILVSDTALRMLYAEPMERVGDVVEAMRRNMVSSLPVVAGGNVLGYVYLHDIAGAPAEERITAYIRRPAFCVRARHTLMHAIRIMAAAGTNIVAVVDEKGVYMGSLLLRDAAAYVAERLGVSDIYSGLLGESLCGPLGRYSER